VVTQAYVPDFSDLNVQFNQARGESFGTDGRYGDAAGRMTGKFMYWRKPTDDERVTDKGWIVTGSATPQELVRQLDKGFQPLRMFGEFALWNPAENWRVSNEPYRRIFQRPGGLSVFPLSQIVEHKWHLVPPYAGVVFPQLEGFTPTDVRCIECRTWFTSPELLNKHRSVAHRVTAQNSMLGESIANAVAKMNEPIVARLSTPDLTQAAIVGALQEQARALSAVAERMSLSHEETRQLYDLLKTRAEYGGHAGVPQPPPEPEDAADTGESAEPLPASAIDVQAPPSGRQRGPNGQFLRE
jgi:hypothetical protein